MKYIGNIDIFSNCRELPKTDITGHYQEFYAIPTDIGRYQYQKFEKLTVNKVILESKQI